MVGKLLSEGLVEEIPARGALPVWRRDEEEGARALRITQRGLAAIQVDEGGAPPQAEKPRDTEQGADLAPDKSSPRVAAARRKKTRNKVPQRSATPGRRDSKQARVIARLQARQGATIATIMKATGWPSDGRWPGTAGRATSRSSLAGSGSPNDQSVTFAQRFQASFKFRPKSRFAAGVLTFEFMGRFV